MFLCVIQIQERASASDLSSAKSQQCLQKAVDLTVSPVAYISRSPYTPLYLSLAVLVIIFVWRYLLAFLLLFIDIDMTDWQKSRFFHLFSVSSFPQLCHFISGAFLPCDAVLAQSICLSQSGTVLKWQNIGSRKYHHMIEQGLIVFWCQRSRRKSNGVTPNVSPNRGRVG